jgi:lysozyme family protein
VSDSFTPDPPTPAIVLPTMGDGPTVAIPPEPTPPPQDRFDICVAVTLSYEGGFADNPKDPGGATNYGITARALAAYLHRAVTTDDVRDMSRDTAIAIYRANYWNAVRCQDMPAGIDGLVFDFVVNSGAAHAIPPLQTITRAAGGADGMVGNKTIAAVDVADLQVLAVRYTAARVSFLEADPDFAEFGNGWMKRVGGLFMANAPSLGFAS